MNITDVAVIADTLAQCGPQTLEQIEREIILYEKRLHWLRLLRDNLQVVDQPKPLPKPEHKERMNIKKMLIHSMNGELVSIREMADQLGVDVSSVRGVFEGNPDLFEKITLDEVANNGKQKVRYRKISSVVPAPQPSATHP